MVGFYMPSLTSKNNLKYFFYIIRITVFLDFELLTKQLNTIFYKNANPKNVVRHFIVQVRHCLYTHRTS